MPSCLSSLPDSVRWLGSWCGSHSWLLLKVAVWLLVWRASIALQFGSVFAVVSCLALVFSQLSHEAAAGGQQRLSAYSVFNRGGARMAGSLSMESWEKQWAPLSSTTAASAPAAAVPGALQSAAPHPKRSSKAANQPCVCGSNKKYPGTASGSSAQALCCLSSPPCRAVRVRYKNCCSPDRESSRDSGRAGEEEGDRDWDRG